MIKGIQATMTKLMYIVNDDMPWLVEVINNSTKLEHEERVALVALSCAMDDLDELFAQLTESIESLGTVPEDQDVRAAN